MVVVFRNMVLNFRILAPGCDGTLNLQLWSAFLLCLIHRNYWQQQIMFRCLLVLACNLFLSQPVFLRLYRSRYMMLLLIQMEYCKFAMFLNRVLNFRLFASGCGGTRTFNFISEYCRSTIFLTIVLINQYSYLPRKSRCPCNFCI
jgi:hypothetical protein